MLPISAHCVNAMKPKTKAVSGEMRADYNFDYAKGVRGKYYKRIQEEGTPAAFSTSWRSR